MCVLIFISFCKFEAYQIAIYIYLYIYLYIYTIIFIFIQGIIERLIILWK